MGLKTAFDITLQACIDFMMFFRDFFDILPAAVHGLIYFAFGLFILTGLMKMIM